MRGIHKRLNILAFLLGLKCWTSTSAALNQSGQPVFKDWQPMSPVHAPSMRACGEVPETRQLVSFEKGPHLVWHALGNWTTRRAAFRYRIRWQIPCDQHGDVKLPRKDQNVLGPAQAGKGMRCAPVSSFFRRATTAACDNHRKERRSGCHTRHRKQSFGTCGATPSKSLDGKGCCKKNYQIQQFTNHTPRATASRPYLAGEGRGFGIALRTNVTPSTHSLA
jgi:hypothetical protein